MPEVSKAEPRISHTADTTAIVQHFRQLLNRQHFIQALAFYEEMVTQNNEYKARLKPVVEAYLAYCLDQCSDGIFVVLVDTWLTSYYDDIPTLLHLAEYQRQRGFHEEAANVLNLAMTYAYTPTQREQVAQALRQLVQSTDDYFSEQQRWIELLGFYEFLDAIALSEPAFGLRQAMIYQLLGESERSRDLLLALRANDDGLNPQWSQTLEIQLEETAPQAAPEPEAVAVNAVPLTRRGDHYLIQATLNNRQQVVLMIDTGASVTSLSRSSFNRLNKKHFHRLGSRLFNTANGLAQGEVYRSDSITLGENSKDDIEIAILDYESVNGVDGLLGMNVLRNYGFEIDQDKELLYLRPR
jgi:clan AA aspartic protease (TIGR02281 family)